MDRRAASLLETPATAVFPSRFGSDTQMKDVSADWVKVSTFRTPRIPQHNRHNRSDCYELTPRGFLFAVGVAHVIRAL